MNHILFFLKKYNYAFLHCRLVWEFHFLYHPQVCTTHNLTVLPGSVRLVGWPPPSSCRRVRQPACTPSTCCRGRGPPPSPTSGTSLPGPSPHPAGGQSMQNIRVSSVSSFVHPDPNGLRSVFSNFLDPDPHQ